MNIDFINSKRFAEAMQSYLAMAFFCQPLTVDDDPSVEYLDDMYGVEDCSEETLEFISGEVLAICLELRKIGCLGGLTTETIGALFNGFGGMAVGSGVHINDNGPIWPLSEEDMEHMSDWHRERWGVHTLEMYPGYDGKVWIPGKEYKKELWMALSVSEGEGKFAARIVYNGEAVTSEALALRKLKDMNESPHNRYTWLGQLTPIDSKQAAE